MSTLFYPGMGIDIVTPIKCIKNLNKIVATGPIPSKRFGKGALDKTMAFMINIVKTGTNIFHEGKMVDDDHFIEFLTEEGVLLKQYNFKTTQMYLLQFRYNDKPITVHYYYGVDPKSAKPWPFKEKFDYVINRDCDVSPMTKDSPFMKNLKPLLKDTTVLISTIPELRKQYNVLKSVTLKLEPIQEYESIVKQTEYRSDGQYKSVYQIPIRDVLNQKPPTEPEPESTEDSEDWSESISDSE
jgi:hypothetical protein